MVSYQEGNRERRKQELRHYWRRVYEGNGYAKIVGEILITSKVRILAFAEIYIEFTITKINHSELYNFVIIGFL